MKILHVLSSIDPRLGGVVEAVRRQSVGLKDAGHSCEVVCTDSPASKHAADFPVPVYRLGPARGKYGYTPRIMSWLAANARNYDTAIVHGIWQFHSLASRNAFTRAGVPYFVFTHGMLDPWFKRRFPFKHLKKWLYWPWADYRALRDAQAVLFTSQEECSLARESFWLYRCRERIVSLGITAPPEKCEAQREAFVARWPEVRGKRVLLFLGRIDVKKGCDDLVEAFAKIAADDLRVHLLMAGPDPSGFGALLRNRCRELGIASRVSWAGMLSGEMKWGAYRCADAFILPSHQENFGFSVVEALACGVPVLISNKINIWREIIADGGGIAADDDYKGALELIQRWQGFDAAESAAMRENALKCFRTRYELQPATRGLISVLQEELSLAQSARAEAAWL
ncbi:MAG TPA: glycosyltransferase [Planctomycetota bacterium]|nr:glycosyltransferase [Planctomycetota bacterium]